MSIDVEDVCQSAISIKFVPALFNISIPLGEVCVIHYHDGSDLSVPACPMRSLWFAN